MLICSSEEIKGWEGPLVIDVEKHQNINLKGGKRQKFFQQAAFTKGAVALIVSKENNSLFENNIDAKKI